MDGRQADCASGNNAALGLTTGDLTALVTYAMQILMAMMMLSMVFVMISNEYSQYAANFRSTE